MIPTGREPARGWVVSMPPTRRAVLPCWARLCISARSVPGEQTWRLRRCDRCCSRLSTYDLEFDRDLGRIAVTDLGDLPLADMLPAAALAPLADAVRSALSTSDALVLLGGDNSITRPGCHGSSTELANVWDC